MSDAGHRWQPICDYEVDPSSLARPKLSSLAAAWRERRAELEDGDAALRLQAFRERLHREWAIETGLIERLYALDQGVTETLIKDGIAADVIARSRGVPRPGRVAQIIESQRDALEGLFAFVKGERHLSTSYVKELHAEITRHQETVEAVDTLGRRVEVPLLRGEYKKHPNNPRLPDGSVHEYCPPEQVTPQMEELLRLHAEHCGVSPEVEAAWLHHRFTRIHPFQDGNGRVARCLASLVLIRAGWFPLVISDTRGERGDYLDALEAADRGNLAPLVDLFAAVQTRIFELALRDVPQYREVDQIIGAAKEFLEDRQKNLDDSWRKAAATAAHLQAVAGRRFQEVAARLVEEIAPLFGQASFSTDEAPFRGSVDQHFRHEISETAEHLGYAANLNTYRAWSCLALATGSGARILLSYHGIGPEFRGKFVISACFFRSGATETSDLTPLCSEIFQIDSQEPKEDAERRFRPWLEEVLVAGLELWRLGL